ncbi:MAG: hypothetical protein KAS12_05970, partial [Candidatus Aenigmarchaeota archaeon]|nr:hypothetical protein [Candidatus Aenigmarchaeota archaeon]
ATQGWNRGDGCYPDSKPWPTTLNEVDCGVSATVNYGEIIPVKEWSVSASGPFAPGSTESIVQVRAGILCVK